MNVRGASTGGQHASQEPQDFDRREQKPERLEEQPLQGGEYEPQLVEKTDDSRDLGIGHRTPFH